jgi:hypothetical protein
VLSIRALDKILTQWQKDGYKYELDYYIWKEFVSQSTIASDRAYLYQLLKDRFDFFQSDGWEQNPNYGAGGVINVFDIKPPQNSSAPKEFFGPRDVAEFAFGKAPERAQWPGIEKKIIDEDKIFEIPFEELEELRAFMTAAREKLDIMDHNIKEFCLLEEDKP